MRLKKRAVTLVEIMIVISLIAVIGGVLSYNLKGALDKGKVFKTEQSQQQISEALEFLYSEGKYSAEELAENPLAYLYEAEFLKDPKKLIKDGWGKEMQVKYENGKFKVISQNLDDYNAKKNNLQKTSSR